MSDVLRRAAELAADWLRTLPERPVAAAGDPDGLRGPLPEHGEDAVAVVEALAAAAEPGLVASPGPRYFGFVTGGALPAAVGADWLTSAWDQNAGLHVMSPAAAVAEETVAGWAKELLGLPAGAGVGVVSGAQMANVTALAAARNAVLAQAGWDVEERGLAGAPALRVIAGAESHATVFNALRLLGLGRGTAVRVPADAQGRMLAGELARALEAGAGPAIVCAQAGNVNTGAFDPLEDIVAACRATGAWCHIDGAFGL
jgi:glutamate/tyrosine decarboxylase-like PLP-dependent enzyme